MKSEKGTNVSIFSLRIEQRGCILLEVAGKTLQPSLSKHHCVQRITTIDKLSGLFLGSIAYEQKQPAELAHTRTSIPCTSTQPLNIWSICNLFLSFLSFQVQSSIAFIYIWHQNAFQTPSDNPLDIGISITHLIRNSKHGSLDVWRPNRDVIRTYKTDTKLGCHYWTCFRHLTDVDIYILKSLCKKIQLNLLALDASRWDMHLNVGYAFKTCPI